MQNVWYATYSVDITRIDAPPCTRLSTMHGGLDAKTFLDRGNWQLAQNKRDNRTSQ